MAKIGKADWVVARPMPPARRVEAECMLRRRFLNTAIGALATSLVPWDGSAKGRRVANGFIRTNWSQDPYSLGSYSYLAKGSWQKDHVELGRPVADRLFFAGEATHPSYNSTVHAAYESGLIAAEAVSETNATSVCIIGAGMSGLAAADALSKEGYDVKVLEARDRIGGRIWTESSHGVALDLGASWIHGIEGNPLIALADNLKILTRATSDRFIIRGRYGRQVPDDEAPDWLENVVSVQHSAGANLGDINTWAYWRGSDYTGDDVVLPEGYAHLLDAFSTDYDIRLGRVVSSVEVGQESVQLRDQSGLRQAFDAVIVTVPLGVLKQGSIVFDPPLPTKKQSAISKLGMGVLDKVYLHYSDVFWDEDVTWIATPENGLPPGQFNQWLNLFPYTGQPVIMAFNGAQAARDLSVLSNTEVVERAMLTLDSAYPLA